MKQSTFFLLIAFSCSLMAKGDTLSTKVDTSIFNLEEDDRVLSMIDSALASRYYKSFQFLDDTSGALTADSVPELIDSVLKERMAILDRQTPFDLRYNQYSKAFINLYVNKKRELSSSVLTLAPRYFPMIEETLDEYQLPLELKYLAIVESALNPSARSRVGAQGLWQFMYATGRMYGLKVTSYYDERMDPIMASRAACEYMSDLYEMYGDWSLVLAAYNSGPGNVNKAIRRSGGLKDYWKIRPFLPRETRGYVPAFIAVNYMMNYAEEHNIFPKKLNLSHFNTDTIYLNHALSFDQISDYLEISIAELEFYNPQYKLNYIPKGKKRQALCLPLDKIGVYLKNEGSIYADIRKKEIADSIAGVEKEPLLPPSITHYVRRGEFLGYIAEKYKVSVRSIMQWNNMYSTRINPGDRLIIYTANGSSTTASNKQASPPPPAKPKVVDNGKYQFHTVRTGDTLWDIAKYYDDITVNDLKRLNSGMNFRRLKPGMQVKIKQIG